MCGHKIFYRLDTASAGRKSLSHIYFSSFSVIIAIPTICSTCCKFSIYDYLIGWRTPTCPPISWLINRLLSCWTFCKLTINFQMFAWWVTITFWNLLHQPSTELVVLLNPFKTRLYTFHVWGGKRGRTTLRLPLAGKYVFYVDVLSHGHESWWTWQQWTWYEVDVARIGHL
jgi:hypothetical protein